MIYMNSFKITLLFTDPLS